MSRTSVRDIYAKYEADEPITMLTAYDAPTAKYVDAAGVDLVLVGDSVGNTQLGHDSTIPVTMEQMLSHTAAVVRGSENPLIIADMPFGAYGASLEQGVENASRLIKEAGAGAVKLETAPGGDATVELVDRLTELGIPVQGHVGLTPQRVNQIGGHVVQGKGQSYSTDADELAETASRLADAGAFSVVIELVTEATGRAITEAVDVPTVGIGAGRHTDGQVLTIHDVLGQTEFDLTFSKSYADLPSVVEGAATDFVEEVESGAFPTEGHVFEPEE